MQFSEINCNQIMNIEKNKFKCRNCNKEYSTIEGAFVCPCQKKLGWKTNKH